MVPRRRRRGTVLCFASLRPKWKQRTVPRRRRRGTFLCFAFMLASYVVRSEAVRCGDVVKCVSFSFTYKIASLLCALSSLEYKSSINLHVVFILSMIFHHFDPYRVPYMTPTQFFRPLLESSIELAYFFSFYAWFFIILTPIEYHTWPPPNFSPSPWICYRICLLFSFYAWVFIILTPYRVP